MRERGVSERAIFEIMRASLFVSIALVAPLASAQEHEALEAELFGAPDPEGAAVEEGALAPPPSDGEDEASREEAMFGAPEDDATPDDAAPPSAVVEGPVGASSSARIAEALLEAEQALAIGGFLFMQLSDAIPEGGGLDDGQLSAPNLFDLYLDARPNDRLRAYVRGRLLYDYTRPSQSSDTSQTVDETDQTDTSGLATGSLATGIGTSQALRAQLDQLWVKFDVGRKVYVTVGKQRIRWGSGRFWNPTDFLNDARINSIALFDQRLGVDLLKVHVPLERLGWNLYAIGMLGEASALSQLGGALRGEFVFGSSELALSFVARQQQVSGPRAFEPFYTPTQSWPQQGVPLRFGADLSTGLGPFEVRLESALTHGDRRPFYRGEFVLDFPTVETPEDVSRREEWIVQTVASVDLTLTYGAGEMLILGAEYFYNGAGYANDDLYLWLALQQSLTPLYLGRHYGALALLIPSPGSWNDSSFTLSALGNLSDGSFLSRLDYSHTVRSRLQLNAYVMSFFGNQGEFRFRVEVPAIPGVSDAPTVIPATRLTLGLGLRMSL